MIRVYDNFMLMPILLKNPKLLFAEGFVTVLLAVVLAFAVVITTGLAIWCVVSQNGEVLVDWKWSIYGVKIKAECATI